jgi:hypothetical protein
MAAAAPTLQASPWEYQGGSMKSYVAIAMTLALGAATACGGGNTTAERTPGAERTTETAALETGADLLQAKAPVEKIAMYLDGFHVSKDDPDMQMEAHHYCNQVNQDFAQCVLFDGNTADARLMGVEYIVSETLYATLPADEKAYWHPHNYEILSGQLRMPGLADPLEKQALKTKINSYGKTWHTWMTGVHNRSADPLPLGPPHLQWSMNHDGEVNQELLSARDQRFGFDTADARQQRSDLVLLTRPQAGVDTLAGHFPAATPIPGVTDNGDPSARPVPTFGLAGGAPMPTGR